MNNLDFSNITGFDWDKGNFQKNWIKHQVAQTEIEELFFNEPLLLFDDKSHSTTEVRWKILGKTNSNRHVLVIFTIRNQKIRPISARDMSKKEKMLYEESTQSNPEV